MSSRARRTTHLPNATPPSGGVSGKRKTREKDDLRPRVMETKTFSSGAGTSSSSRTKSRHICGICMEGKPPSDLVFINGCSHSYCSTCVSRYISDKVLENVAVITCPYPGCVVGSFEPEFCKPMLPREVFDHWCLSLCVCAIKNKFYCPFNDCSALLTDERDEEVIREAECPHCHRLFCAQCRSSWHPDVACEEFQKLGKNEREDVMLKSLAKNKGWNRCPLCHFYVEKLSGCSTMKCRCGNTFCYGCGQTMATPHYCTFCKR